MVDDERFSLMEAFFVNSEYEPSGCATVIMELEAEQTVTVRSLGSDIIIGTDSTGFYYSWFTGHLLYRLWKYQGTSYTAYKNLSAPPIPLMKISGHLLYRLWKTSGHLLYRLWKNIRAPPIPLMKNIRAPLYRLWKTSGHLLYRLWKNIRAPPIPLMKKHQGTFYIIYEKH